jgi:hypothetical protein
MSFAAKTSSCTNSAVDSVSDRDGSAELDESLPGSIETNGRIDADESSKQWAKSPRCRKEVP